MQNDDVAKRRQYRRKKARRKHLKVFFIIFMLFLILLGIALSLTVLFPIKNVIVKGTNLYELVQIKNSANLVGKNIFTVSEKNTEESLRKKFPYIDTIEINRKLPDTVELKISDAKEFLLYKSEEKYYSISKREYVLEKYSEPVQNIPVIITDKVKCKVGQKIIFEDVSIKETTDKLISEIGSRDISIDYIDITDKNNITVGIMNNRFKVLIGSSSYLENKCAHLSGMVKSINEGEKGTINLTMWTTEKSEGTFIKDSNSEEK